MVDYKELKNPLSIHEDILKRLSKDLQEIESIDSDFRQSILRYLVDGEDEQVIDEISFFARSGKSLKFKSEDGWQKVVRSKNFQTTRVETAPFYCRLAKFYS